MLRAIHFGPINSKGGMSSVIGDLIENAPEGWSSDAISTHSDAPAKMIFQWIKARKRIEESGKRKKNRYCTCSCNPFSKLVEKERDIEDL